MFRIQTTIEADRLIIYIEGKINSIDEIVNIISEKINIETGKIKEIVFDLAKLEFISDSCLAMLKQLKKTNNIKFKNYSSFLYTEMRLNEFQLLEEESHSKT